MVGAETPVPAVAGLALGEAGAVAVAGEERLRGGLVGHGLQRSRDCQQPGINSRDTLLDDRFNLALKKFL